MNRAWNFFVLVVPIGAILFALVAASFSPQLAWRRPVYIASGFAGVIGLSLLLIQPLLAGRYFPSLSARQSRLFHRVAGILLLIAVTGHIIGLWITSPPDMVDVLLLRSPTPFSLWGVVAMWAIFGAGLLALLKGRFQKHHRSWRNAHFAFASVACVGTVVHAVQIEGTMETVSKMVLCGLVLCVIVKLGYDLRIWRLR